MPKFYFTGRNSTDLDFFIQQSYGELSKELHQKIRDTLIESNPRGIRSIDDRLGNRRAFTNSLSVLCMPDSKAIAADLAECQRLGRQSAQVSSLLGPHENALLGDIINDFGSEALDWLMATESFVQRHKTTLVDLNTYATGANYVVTRRLGQFADALQEYDRALRQVAPNKAAFRSELIAADSAFKHLQRKFGIEMQTLRSSNRYSDWMYRPYDSFAGGLNASAKNPRAPLADLEEVTRLQRVLKATQSLGKGFLVVDIAARSASVLTSNTPGYQLGKEATSFGVAAGASWVTYTAILSSKISGLLLATPHGWIVLLIAVGAGAATAFLSDVKAKEMYDSLFKSSRPLIGTH